MFRLINSKKKKMRCVFPSAVKPWQKVACGAVGVAALAGGIYSLLSATKFGIRQLTQRVDLNVILPALPDTNVKIEPSEGALFVAQGAFTVALPTWVVSKAALGLYRDRLFLFRPLIEEYSAFYRAIKGTECCNIVRSTARFCLTGSTLSVMAIYLVGGCIGLGAIAVLSARDMFTTVKGWNTGKRD